MRIYFDVSCLDRPFDDQRQARVRLEAEAVLMILQRVDGGKWSHVSSEVAVAEISATIDPERRRRVLAMLPPGDDIIRLDDAMLRRAAQLRQLGLGPADALHVAAAESQPVEVFLTCDEQLLRVARRHKTKLRVCVADPITWMKEHEDKPNP